jgi:hypothetical protein
MKLIPLVLISLTSIHAADELAPPPSSAAVKHAAQTFYTELRAKPAPGLPTPERVQELSAHLTPALRKTLLAAWSHQQRQIALHPDEKPEFVESDIFSSHAEGVTSWKLGDARSIDFGATADVLCVQESPGYPKAEWTDTLYFRQQKGQLLLDDIRFGGAWLDEDQDSLRHILPGGQKQRADHTSPDEKWKVKMHIVKDDPRQPVMRITLLNGDESKTKVLYEDKNERGLQFGTWCVWSADSSSVAIRLGETPRFNDSIVWRLQENEWQQVKLPELYAKEREECLKNGFRERNRQYDALHWEDNETLVIRCFLNFTKEDEGDGYMENVSVHLPIKGNAHVTHTENVW